MQRQGQRTQPRIYFHKGHTPKVLVMKAGQPYVGIMLDYSSTGIGIALQNFPGRELQEESCEEIYIGKTQKEYCVNNLLIAYINENSGDGSCYLGLYANTPEKQRELEEVLLKIKSTEPEASGTHFRTDRQPLSSGQMHFSSEAIETRQKWVEFMSGHELAAIKHHNFSPQALGGNIENFIGAVQVPLGIAGPISIKGMYANGSVAVPIATTEGALIASISRGARVCSLAGGVRTFISGQTMQRSPTFFCENLEGAINFHAWVEKHKMEIKRKAESVSNIAKLEQLDTFVFGNSVHLTFAYSTGDAAGQNMTTSCTFMACEWIVSQIQSDKSIRYSSYMIEGNHSGDKKLNAKNFLSGRGISVFAEAVVSNFLLEKCFRVNVKDMVRNWQSAEVAAMRIGTLGANINFANVIAGIFAATGQDIACVHESSAGILKMREENNSLIVSAYLPSLVIGTVGGGTALPTQKESLQIMNCYGVGNSFRLAEIIAATCLALDLSTGAAITAKEFTQAHDKLGRNRPNRFLARSELNATFFTSLLHESTGKIESASEIPLDISQGITSNILLEKRGNLSGIFKFSTLVNPGEGQKSFARDCVLKLKSSASDVVEIGIGVAKLSGDDCIPGLFEINRSIFGYDNCDVREIRILIDADPKILGFCPEVYGSCINPERSIYALLMEDLSKCELINSVNTPEKWTEVKIKQVLSSLGHIHSCYLNKFERLPSEAMVEKHNHNGLLQAREFLRILTQFNASRYPNLLSKELTTLAMCYLDNLDTYLSQMAEFPETLTHNDCSPRNICFRNNGNEQSKAIFYDWELCTFQNPQRDIVEFLCFVSENQPSKEWIKEYLDFYRKALSHEANLYFSEKEFDYIAYLNALDFLVTRINLYILVNNITKFTFLERVCKTLEAYLLHFKREYFAR